MKIQNVRVRKGSRKRIEEDKEKGNVNCKTRARLRPSRDSLSLSRRLCVFTF